MLLSKRSAAAALIAVAAALAAFLPASSAEATSYRFWIYWTGGSGDWDFAAQGASRRPADGAVEGWRFAISEEVGASATPRLSSSFQQICGSTQPVQGKKRVGLVIDFGTGADAPSGQSPPPGPVARCVVAPTTANGYEILTSVTSLRVDDGMICGIAGYPTSGCGEVVRSPKPDKNSNNNPDNDTGPASPGSNPDDASSSTNPEGSNNGAGVKPDDKQNQDSKNKDSESKNDREVEDEADISLSEQESSDAAVAAAASNALPTTDTGSPVGRLGWGWRHRGTSGRGSVAHPKTKGEPMTRRTKSLPRNVHPVAWWIWAIALAAAASRTLNPLLLLTILGVAAVVVSARRTDAPWSASFRAFVIMGAIVLGVRIVFEVFFGPPIPGTVAFTLPTVALPDAMAGVRLGGPVTYEGLGLGSLLRPSTGRHLCVYRRSQCASQSDPTPQKRSRCALRGGRRGCRCRHARAHSYHPSTAGTRGTTPEGTLGAGH